MFDDLPLVVGVEDDEVVGVVGEVEGFAAQNLGAGGVECAHGEAARWFAQQGLDAVAHFARGFVGEGDGEDAPGGDTLFLDKVGDALGEDAGFAAARSGEDEDGAIGGGDGEVLGLVEAVK